MINGARVDIQDIYGNTPLHIACEKGYMECVKILTKHVEYHEIKDLSIIVPFRGVPQKSTIRNYDGQTCLHLAAKNRHFDIVYYLTQNLHHDINLQEGKQGCTPLMDCIERNDTQMLMYLVQQCNGNIHFRTYDRKNALELAKGRGFTKMVKLLQDLGAIEDFEPMIEENIELTFSHEENIEPTFSHHVDFLCTCMNNL